MQNSGISSQVYSLLNNEEFRPTTNLVVSKCDAYDYLDNVRPNLEKLTTNYYDTFSITNKFTGYFSDITVGEFFNTLSMSSCDGTAILGGLDKTARQEEKSGSSSSSSSSENESSSSKNSSSEESSKNSSSQSSFSQSSEQSMADVITNPEDLTAGTSSVEGKRGSENIGIAVFDDDKLCGELTAIETICHLLINNDIDSCIVSIDNPYKDNSEEKIELTLTPTKKSKISVKIENGVPNISAKINLQASILTLEKDINYEENKVLETFSNSTENYLEKEFNEYFNKVSKDYGTDIDCFCNKALAHFTTTKEWEDYNWSEKFKNAKFDIDVNIDAISSMLLTKT